MHASVLLKWHEFSEPLEGRVHWLYADVKQLLTAGVGNLADPLSLALKMPWRLPDGSLAPPDEVTRQWHAVKAQAPRLAKLHYKYAAPYSTMRLTDDDIDGFVAQRLALTERALKRAFPGWDAFPADAQLGCLSMAWAVGDGYPSIFKNFTRAINQGDFAGARASCKIRTEGNPGVIPRNRNNELCFDNAAQVIARGLPIDVLNWPNAAPEGVAPTAAQPASKTELLSAISDADRARHAAFTASYAQHLVSLSTQEGLRELSGHEGPAPEGEPIA